VKTAEKDKYEAIQVGFDAGSKRMKKPALGHLKELKKFRY
jgi:hypothetical protein